jgi:hypothetical protein
MRTFSNFIDEANSTTTADKKDELYTDANTGKLKVRKVPVNKNIIKKDYTIEVRNTFNKNRAILQEETDKSLIRLQQLARAGMMDQGQLPQLTRALKALGAGKVVNPQDRQILLDLLNELIGVITGDDSIFAKAKSTIKKG